LIWAPNPRGMGRGLLGAGGGGEVIVGGMLIVVLCCRVVERRGSKECDVHTRRSDSLVVIAVQVRCVVVAMRISK
jgi:hypothetical protein